jgi:hypothetical protein
VAHTSVFICDLSSPFFGKKESENAAANSSDDMGTLRNIIICKGIGNLFSQKKYDNQDEG